MSTNKKPNLTTITAIALTYDVDRSTVWRWITRDGLPVVVRRGRVIRLDPDVVERWLSEGQGGMSGAGAKTKTKPVPSVAKVIKAAPYRPVKLV